MSDDNSSLLDILPRFEDNESVYVPLNSVLSAASMIGMAMMLRGYLFGSGDDEDTSEERSFDNTRMFKRKRRRRKYPRKKLFKYPESYSFQDYEEDNAKSPLDLIYNDFEDYSSPEHVIDFYEDKNYEYIDQDDSASMNMNDIDNINNLKFKFENIDYDNYEYEEVGVLDFREPVRQQQETSEANQSQTFFKRRQRFRPKKRVHYSGMKYLPKNRLLNRRLKHDQEDDRRKRKRSNTLAGLQTTFDLSSLITIGGLWAIWQVFLVRSSHSC